MKKIFANVHDTEGALREACKAGDIEFSKEVEQKVCFFLAHLIEKLWNKFPIEDIELQFLLAKKLNLILLSPRVI
jgi:hypothetical protein